MVRSNPEIEALIAKFLNGEASPEEALKLERWRTESAENQQLMDACERDIAELYGRKAFQPIDVEQKWKELKKELPTEKTIPLWRNRLIIGAAAAILLAFVVFQWTKRTIPPTNSLANDVPQTEAVKEQPTTSVIVASEAVQTYTLKDDTKVVLEPNSRLKLSKDFNEKDRRTTLEGSGTFSVIHDEDKPFVIAVEGLQIVDLGTVFSVNTHEDTVSVVVTEGIVELRLNSETIELTEGDSAFYVISEQLIDRYAIPEARADKVFVFDGTSLEEVAHVLSDFFNRKIVIMDESISNCELSVTFKNEDLPTILDIIRELMDVKIIQNNEIIGIYGEGCL